jgi:hypothetical protein
VNINNIPFRGLFKVNSLHAYLVERASDTAQFSSDVIGIYLDRSISTKYVDFCTANFAPPNGSLRYLLVLHAALNKS